MGPDRISQSKPLISTYQSGDQSVSSVPTPGTLGGKSVESAPGGVAKAGRGLSSGSQITGRLKAGLRSFSNKSLGLGQREDRQTLRFNARQEKLASGVHKLTGSLVSGDRESLNSDTLGELRQSARLLHQDAPGGSSDELLASALDAELGRLNDDDLQQLKQAVYGASTGQLSAQDQADVSKLKESVLRQEVARSSELGSVIRLIRTDGNLSADGLQELTLALANVNEQIGSALEELGRLSAFDSQQILASMLKIAIQRQAPDNAILADMNIKLLNAVHEQRAGGGLDSNQSKPDLPGDSLLLLANTVRTAYLKALAAEQRQSTESLIVSGISLHRADDEQIAQYARSGAIGIDAQAPRILERNLFTDRIDKHLGFSVCASTSLSVERGQLGVAVSPPAGNVAHDVYGCDRSDAGLQRGLTKLQLLDVLLGQADRNGANFAISRDPETGHVSSVTAFDNDFCAGSKAVTPGSSFIPGMPPVVDTEMAQALRAMTEDDLVQLAGGLLEDAALNALKNRLNFMQKELSHMEAQGLVIQPNEWGSNKVDSQMKQHGNASNSYCLRFENLYQPLLAFN